MSQAIQNRTQTRISLLQIAIIILALVSACVHLFLAVRLGLPRLNPIRPFPLLFYLNFLGYIVLLAGFTLPSFARYQSTIRWVLIGYVAITVIAWYLFTHANYNLIAYIDKPIELALIVLLLVDTQRARARSR
jgi:hypothetical protein